MLTKREIKTGQSDTSALFRTSINSGVFLYKKWILLHFALEKNKKSCGTGIAVQF